MSAESTFVRRLEQKARQQLSARRVGFLLGAGSSNLGGSGYPVASELWAAISTSLPVTERNEIQSRIDSGANGLEHALDLLDRGGIEETAHRGLVTRAISDHFASLSPPLEAHKRFVANLSRRSEFFVPVFSLNYDPLVERASEASGVRLVDGFQGIEDAFFDPNLYQERHGILRRSLRFLQPAWRTGVVHLLKLHGSLGWYEQAGGDARRVPFSTPIPPSSKLLMVPPQFRKAVETTSPPYSQIWSEFRGLLCQGPVTLNRLAVIGYGMADEHVNSVLLNALARSDFTLLIFAMHLSDSVFDRWRDHPRTIIVTNDRSSMSGTIGSGHPSLWNFEDLFLEG